MEAIEKANSIVNLLSSSDIVREELLMHVKKESNYGLGIELEIKHRSELDTAKIRMTEPVETGNAFVDDQSEDILKGGLIVVKKETDIAIEDEVESEGSNVGTPQLAPVEQHFLPETTAFRLNGCKIEPLDETCDENEGQSIKHEEDEEVYCVNDSLISEVKPNNDKRLKKPSQTKKENDYVNEDVGHGVVKGPDAVVSPIFGKSKGKKHECEMCLKTFSYRCELRAHVRTHTGEKPYSCHVCLKEFFHKSSLKTHMSSHMEEESVLCTLCDKTFSSNYFRKHILIHTSEKRVICNICDRAFAFNSELENHKRTHTGEKPFVCATCSKSFATKYSLQVHLQSHSGERPFICRQCNKTFARKDVLLTHMQSHTGERPFACNVCNRRFPRKGLIKLHMRSHLAEKNYPCYICNKPLSRRDSMLRHIQLNHPEHQK